MPLELQLLIQYLRSDFPRTAIEFAKWLTWHRPSMYQYSLVRLCEAASFDEDTAADFKRLTESEIAELEHVPEVGGPT